MKKGMVLFFVMFLLLSTVSSAAQKETVKIAVASEGKAMTAAICNLAARCPYYLIFDRSGNLIEVLDNPHRDASRGAGRLVVSFLMQKGVTTLVAGNVGDKMLRAMRIEGIAYLAFSGSAEGAVKKVLMAL